MKNTVALDATARNGKGNQRDQSQRNLTVAADGGKASNQSADSPQALRLPVPKLDSARSTASLRLESPCHTCKVRVKVALFFDGTGNNLDADVDTKEHSNVARLFRSHPESEKTVGTYRIYIPGLGTYFKDIGDPGDEDGLAFGKRGEPRLQWAMGKIDEFVAKHPVANISGLDIALFGFSRGAALARAFARRIQDRCRNEGGTWRWDKGGFEARLYFMGLFDTVSSVGLPASTSVNSVRIAKKRVTLDVGLRQRRHATSNGLLPLSTPDHLGIALGDQPGADPTPGLVDGHGAWASDLRIPAMVMQCVHYVSAHEMRNSFPVDSVRVGQRLPPNAQEFWSPGVHSNVGGGYRPGEGGRSMKPAEALSLATLLPMHDAALAAGVPLGPKNAPWSEDDFVVLPALIDLYNTYIRTANAMACGTHLEARLLTNRKLQLAWRFKRIRERAGGVRPDAAAIRGEERRYDAERVQLDAEIAAAAQDPARLQAQKTLADAQTQKASADAHYDAVIRRDWSSPAQVQAAAARKQAADASLARAGQAFANADDRRSRLQARQSTLGGAGLVGTMDDYDRQLMLDVEAIREVRRRHPSARLRPHYANLLEAHDAEFVAGKGLLDRYPEVLAFFDRHVHDSLAGFAMDETLPSDPRIVYVGGDDKSRYADGSPSDRLTA